MGTRDRILHTTWKLMEARGGAGVKMSDIAKASDVSRQAVYLHFKSRAELLVQTTRFIDEQLELSSRLQPSRDATNAHDRLNAYIEFWGYYWQDLYGIAKAVLAFDHPDAEAAWADRMRAHRAGCAGVVEMAEREGYLRGSCPKKEAIDLLFTLLSFGVWETLVVNCKWQVDSYIEHIKRGAGLALFGTAETLG